MGTPVLEPGELLTVISVTNHAVTDGWVRSYLLRVRRERDDTYHHIDVARGALLHVRRAL